MILTPEQLDEVLQHYPNYVHDLIIRQLSVLSAMLINNKELYTKDEGFRKAFDMMLSNVVEGRFLPIGVKPIE